MSILGDIKIELDPIIADAKALASKAVDYLKDVAISSAQKAVAFIKESELGTKIMNLISKASLVTDPDVKGADKFNAIVDIAMEAYKAFVGTGILKSIIDTGVNVLRQVIQSLYDDFVAAFAKA